MEGVFHGKTLGAVQLTANKGPRSIALTGLEVMRIRLNDMEHLEATFAGTDNLAGFIFEPILGEGGVWPVEPAFAKRGGSSQRRVPSDCRRVSNWPGTYRQLFGQ